MYAIGRKSANRSAHLEASLSGDKHVSCKLKQAQSLFAEIDDEIASSVDLGGSTAYRTKCRLERNLDGR